MKRSAAFLLTLLLVFTLCSCGKKHVEEQTVPPAVEDQTGEQQPEVKPAPQPVKPEVKPDDAAEDETVVTAPVTPVVKPQGGTSGGGSHHHGGGTTVKDLTITEEKTVTGGTYDTVTIAASVGNGTVTLDGVTIQKKLVVRGGGSNSIKVVNSTVPTVVLDKDTGTDAEAPRLELTGTKVKTVEVSQPAIIEATDTMSKVETLSAKDDVTIKGENTKIDTITVPETVTGKPAINVSAGSVNTVEARSEASVSGGESTIANVEAAAPVEVDSTAVGKVTVTVNVTVTVTGSGSVEVAVEVETSGNEKVTIQADAGAAVTVSTTQENAPTVAVNSTIIEHIHKWNAGTVQAAASCDTAGSMLYTCTSCTATKTETIPALGHIYGVPVFSWSGTNCTAARTCTRSECSHADSAIAQVSRYEQKMPSCTENGVTVYTATAVFDGKTYSDTTSVTVDPTDHTAVKQNGQAATCEENGWKDYYKCSECRKLFSDADCTNAITDLTAWKTGGGKLAALGHDWAEAWNSDAAGHWHVCRHQGCNAAGTKENHVPGAAATETAAQTCTVCGYELAPATGHLCVNHLTKTDAVAATCTQPGNSAYWSCTCGKYYSDATAENKIEKDSWILPVIDHTFNQEKAEATYLKSAATCTAKAVYYKSCTCGAKGTETFEYGSALGHSFTNYVSDTNATCTADGSKTAKCDRCDVTDTVADADSKLGHSFTNKASTAKVSDATCTAKAVYKVQCDRCDAVSDTVTVEVGDVNLSNHDYGAPTYSWNGTQCTAERVCTRDANHKETETANGVYTVMTEPTYTEDGSAVYKATFTSTAFAEQTLEAVTLPAMPFKVGENTYATYAEALDAAHKAGLKEEQLFELTYKVYPTIEIYGSCTVEGNLNVATHESIAVKNGGSLTVTGSLTLGESTMEGWMIDAGMLNLEQGSSFKLGDVQYTGTSGAFAVNDADSRIELTGKAKDMLGNDKVTMFFGDITMQGSFTMDSSCTFINDNGSVLTVTGTLTSESYLENRSEIRIVGGKVINKATIDNESDIAKAMGVTGQINILSKGTLTNEANANITGGSIDAFGSIVTNAGTINNKKTIAVYGGKLTNSGEIVGVYEMNDIGFEDWSTYVSIEKGATLNNTGTITDLINVADYYTSAEKIGYIYDDTDGTLGENARVEKVAAVFDLGQLQTVWDDGSYVNVIVSGSNTASANTVELGGVTVPRGQRLVLKSSVFDGVNTYSNSYKVSNGTLLTVEGMEENVEDGPKGELVTVGAPDVTVTGKLTTYGFTAFDQLTINGHVDCEADMLLVAQSLTIGAEGKLEIGGEGTLRCNDGVDVTIAEGGQLLTTVRYMNGLMDRDIFAQSEIEGAEPTGILKTLVITDDTLLYGDHTVDSIVLIGGNLQLFKSSTLTYKGVYGSDGKERTAPAEWSVSTPDANGYYTVTGDYDAAAVDSVSELKKALESGGEIYLLPMVKEEQTDVSADFGEPEGTFFESQYHINKILSNKPFNCAKDIQLIGICSEEDTIAVFFDDGFDLAEGKTLRFDGLNVVAAADSTVNGRVEVCNGILVVQGENGATLTNNGTIQIGSEEVWGQFAIFDENAGNKIVNNGTIESFGELKFDRDQNREPHQFEGYDPIEYATFRDLVCELQQNFGNLPNLEQIDFGKRNDFGVEDFAPVYAYPDGGNEFFNADDPEHSDYDAIEAFSWLIKNEIVPQYNEQTNPKLNPWHYMTYNEVGELFNKFASKVLASETDLGITGGSNLADKNPCFGKLHEALGGLSRAEVSDEQALRNALNTPYVTEIHVTYDIVLSNNIDLQPAGEYHDQHREIFVEPGVTLTVAQEKQMDIKQNVKLELVEDENDNGKLHLATRSNLNVFGELKPDNWGEEIGDGDSRQRKYVIEEEGSCVNFFGDAYFFGEKLLEVAGEYMSQKDVIPEGYDRIDGWDNNEKVKCLVAYGLEPESDENESWWNFGRTPEYGQMLTILANVYRDATGEPNDLPVDVKAGDEGWTPNDGDCLDNRSVEELLGKFALVLPKLEDATDSFTVIKDSEQTITGKTFTNPVTITCDKDKTEDDFGGDIHFRNCEFKQGVEVQLAEGIGYNIRLEGCTGSFTVTAEDDIKGAERTGVNFFGDLSGVTVNGLSINGINGWNDESYNVNVRYDECGESSGVKAYISTAEVVNRRGGEDNIIFISGSDYTGKLRVAGKLNISSVSMGEGSMLELSNEAGEANIALGGNRITVNDDCGGEYHFTGTGEVYVPNQNGNARITVNGVDLDKPHVFGDSEPYAIFLGLADVNGVTFEVKQGDDVLTGKSVGYDKSGKPEGSDGFDGSKVEKTHLEQDGKKIWITDPNNISLTVTAGGCTIVYDKLWYKDE